jgi:3-mercaptopyruvate sulfurtransferase SseA
VRFEVFGLFRFGTEEAPPEQIERLFRSVGISPGKKIVMYDAGGTWFATRLFFSLDYFGFPTRDLFILDGGFSKWQAEGMPVTKEVAAPGTGSFSVRRLNEDVRARLPEFVSASGDLSRNVLLEALDTDWHFGAQGFFGKPGHVPHAVSLPGPDFFNPDKTFKSPEEMKRMLDYFSIRPEQRVYSHCGGGGVAAVPYFALKYVVRYPNVKLFNESQLGWLGDDRELPFWTYDAPYLMREAAWVQAWGGKMMRMYGIAQVSVVDVRPASSFAQGHLPFALNVPAGVFADNAGNPAKLAEALGLAGVKASDEAVVVSGAGVTKESALAFAMLEKLGQRKVSIFMDSTESIEAMDKLAQRGLAATKEPSAAPATKYPASVRDGVMIGDPKATHGVFPKVFVASGSSVPAAVPEGKVVHLPYTELINADGTPKAAKEIWNVLAKAGVPRYAELVFFSDDPGEAAVNYFVLKLMGYPDIKVLM